MGSPRPVLVYMASLPSPGPAPFPTLLQGFPETLLTAGELFSGSAFPRTQPTPSVPAQLEGTQCLLTKHSLSREVGKSIGSESWQLRLPLPPPQPVGSTEAAASFYLRDPGTQPHASSPAGAPRGLEE